MMLKSIVRYLKTIYPMHKEKILPEGAARLVLAVFETLKNIDFQRGISTFKNEKQNEAICIIVMFPKIFPSCIRACAASV